MQATVGPTSVDEAKQWFSDSYPWGGTFRFDAGLFEFKVLSIDTEESTNALLFNVKYEDGDLADFYWSGKKGLYNSLDQPSKNRIRKMLMLYKGGTPDRNKSKHKKKKRRVTSRVSKNV